jgi:DNA-binding transcriptional regulator YiaG
MKKYQSEALKVIHQDVEGLHRLGIISDKEMREYDQDCLIHESEPAYTAVPSPKTGYAATSH